MHSYDDPSHFVPSIEHSNNYYVSRFIIGKNGKSLIPILGNNQTVKEKSSR